jgi:hypothetical protein
MIWSRGEYDVGEEKALLIFKYAEGATCCDE